MRKLKPFEPLLMDEERHKVQLSVDDNINNKENKLYEHIIIKRMKITKK